MSRHN